MRARTTSSCEPLSPPSLEIDEGAIIGESVAQNQFERHIERSSTDRSFALPFFVRLTVGDILGFK